MGGVQVWAERKQVWGYPQNSQGTKIYFGIAGWKKGTTIRSLTIQKGGTFPAGKDVVNQETRGEGSKKKFPKQS